MHSLLYVMQKRNYNASKISWLRRGIASVKIFRLRRNKIAGKWCLKKEHLWSMERQVSYII